MRYFLFTYNAVRSSGHQSIGNIFFKDDQFPSNITTKELIISINTDISFDTIVITNIFEFKSEQDYIDFTAK